MATPSTFAFAQRSTLSSPCCDVNWRVAALGLAHEGLARVPWFGVSAVRLAWRDSHLLMRHCTAVFGACSA